MTTALVRQELGRPKLEALVVAHSLAAAAIGHHALAAEFLEALDPNVITRACLELVEQASSCEDVGAVTFHSKAQRTLSDRALGFTLAELYSPEAFRFETLVALCNQLPAVRAMPTSAWQEDLAVGLSAASEA